MPILRAQVRMPYYTNIPRDIITNTFHFFWDGVTPFEDACNYLTGRLDTMYTSIYGGTGTNKAAPWVTWASTAVHWYDMSTPPPRVPYVVPCAITAAVDTSCTTTPETAIVLSYQADPLAGTPQARRRGRIFLGGLGDSWLTLGDDDTFPGPNPTFVGYAITALQTNLVTTGDAGLQWVVYSQVASMSSVVTNGWVDNELDTQRRRQPRATSRTIWP